MLRFLERLHDLWHNYVLLAIYHVMDVYLCSDRVRSAIIRVTLLIFLTIFSVLMFFTFTRWLPGTKNMFNFPARNYQQTDDVRPIQPEIPQETKPIPVEDSTNY